MATYLEARERHWAQVHKPPRRRSRRVAKHWDLLVQMRKLIDDDHLTLHKAGVVLAEAHWLRVKSKTKAACVHWFEDNERNFRGELQSTANKSSTLSTVIKRLTEANAWFDRECPNWREEQREEYLRGRDRARKAAEKWDRDHPEEAAERRRAAEKAAEKQARKDWHKWFEDDPKAALRQMLEDIKQDEESFEG
jgi:hypothetical protein